MDVAPRVGSPGGELSVTVDEAPRDWRGRAWRPTDFSADPDPDPEPEPEPDPEPEPEPDPDPDPDPEPDPDAIRFAGLRLAV